MNTGFRLRSWRKTSERICATERFPPGFRIVLLGPSGRARPDTVKVRSGDFGMHPAGYSVGAFLCSVMDVSIDEKSPLASSTRVELRDSNNRRVDETLTLRRVRDLPGLGGLRAQEIEDDEDLVIPDLKADIEDALGPLDRELDFRLVLDDELMLKALFDYILDRFETDAIHHVIELNRRRLDRPE